MCSFQAWGRSGFRHSLETREDSPFGCGARTPQGHAEMQSDFLTNTIESPRAHESLSPIFPSGAPGGLAKLDTGSKPGPGRGPQGSPAASTPEVTPALCSPSLDTTHCPACRINDKRKNPLPNALFLIHILQVALSPACRISALATHRDK